MRFKFLNFNIQIFKIFFVSATLSAAFVPLSAAADFLNQTVLFNIDGQYEYSGRKQVSAALRKISNKAYWYVSDEYWNGISAAEQNSFSNELDKLAQEFDARIYPAEVSFWGSEWNPGVDGDPRITVLLTRLIAQAGGYYDTANEYKKSQAPDSNEREMVFINTSGISNGRAKIFLAHEFQHLASFYQKEKLRNLTEDIWLNEARSEYSVKLSGYDADFENSNLRRRLAVFVQNPSEPLGEWKNLAPDYGAIALFSYYLTDHYGDKVLADSLKNGEAGIKSVEEALKLNGFSETFSGIFSDWTVANVLNDSSAGSKFAYKSEDLKNFKVLPTQKFFVSGFGTDISVFNTVKDWQPVWYEFDTSIGYNGNLKVDFLGSAGSKFAVPYITFRINGKKEIGFADVSGGGTLSVPNSPAERGGTFFIKGFGSDVHKAILIPANHSKISGFGENDPESSFSFKARVVSEVPEVSLPPVQPPAPSPPAAQSIQMILDQIKSLQEQISGLQSQPGNPPISSFSLNRDLFVGSAGNDVRRLQEFLAGEGVYPEARITGYFGPLTRGAVARFQEKHGISPQIGYVGFKTRTKIQELIP